MEEIKMVRKERPEKLGHSAALREGRRDGLPVALGYFAVAFALGIAARRAGLHPVQGFVASLLCNASAGEYAGFALISTGAALWEVALMTLVVNARYLLMSAALSQKFSPNTPLRHRFLVGFDVTDELFGIAIARPGWFDPYYYYGAMAVSMPGWAFGTLFGVLAGNVLPQRLVSALSVALYGMFLAVIVPPARKDRVVAVLIPLCFLASWGAASLPGLSGLSAGTRTILLTVVIAGAAALLFPLPKEEEREGEHEA